MDPCYLGLIHGTAFKPCDLEQATQPVWNSFLICENEDNNSSNYTECSEN